MRNNQSISGKPRKVSIKVKQMSEIIEAITGMIEVIADNPASILIVLGFLSILLTIFIPLGVSIQILLGGLGFLMLICGIILHIVWLNS
jgi:phage-related minor tail protein